MPTKISSYLTELGFKQITNITEANTYNKNTAGEFLVIKENNKVYRYENNSTLEVDNSNILNTSDGGNTRWIAISGDSGGGVNIPSQAGNENKFLTTDGANLSWNNAISYNNITNCLTEIPQDIKLELNDSTLTLKAGSKVYVPNGAGVFDVVTISSDVSGTTTSNGKLLVSTRADGNQLIFSFENTTVSGGTNPQQTYTTWYDITNNVINRYTDNTENPAYTLSLPIAIITVTSSVITSIDQVFNGFGYIGNTLFALPGIKGLIPNGFNTDGSLNSTEFTTTSVSTLNNTSSGDKEFTIANTQKLYNIFSKGYIKYVQKENVNRTTPGSFVGLTVCGTFSTDSTGRITSLTPNTAFHATDYNEFAREVGRCAKLDEDNEFTKNITFLSNTRLKSNNTDINNITQASSSNLFMLDKKGVITGVIQRYYSQTGSDSISMILKDKDGNNYSISLNKNTSGKVYCSVPTPEIGVTGNEAVTANWVNSKFKVVSTLPAEPDPNVFYFIPEE